MRGEFSWRESNMYPTPSLTEKRKKERMDGKLGVWVVLMDQLCKSLNVFLRGSADSFLETLVF